MKKILLAEDDEDLSIILKQFLELNDFDVKTTKNGLEALKTIEKENFDLCILDVMMPMMDGFTVAEKIIEIKPEIPFVFLTAKQLKEDKIKGLQLGADDYIVKPFEAEELVLRLNNILKRNENHSKTSNKEIIISNYIFDTARKCLKINNKIQQLTEKEALLIEFLYNNKNQILKREEILKAVWKTNDYFSGRSMDVFITKIRKYFQEDNKISIDSIRFIGLEFKIKE